MNPKRTNLVYGSDIMCPSLLFARELCSASVANRGNNTFHRKYDKRARAETVIPDNIN
jgi:hypothetical protein